MRKLRFKLQLNKIPKEKLKSYLNFKNEGILIMVVNITVTSEGVVDNKFDGKITP
jgi:hypothetical protein